MGISGPNERCTMNKTYAEQSKSNQMSPASLPVKIPALFMMMSMPGACCKGEESETLYHLLARRLAAATTWLGYARSTAID